MKRGNRRSPTQKEPEFADDPIPLDAISIGNASVATAKALDAHPDVFSTSDEMVVGIFEHSVEALRESFLPCHPSEILQVVYLKANLLLRLHISEGQLRACVRDPNTGDILQLGKHGWIPLTWFQQPVPFNAWCLGDFLHSASEDAPGPFQTIVREKVRPLFFVRKEFEEWYSEKFGAPEQNKATATSTFNWPLSGEPGVSVLVAAHRRLAVKRALIELYGPQGPPLGEMAKSRNAKINAWLKRKELGKVGESTIRRALKELRTDRT